MKNFPLLIFGLVAALTCAESARGERGISQQAVTPEI
jgi:hypothetical protein